MKHAPRGPLKAREDGIPLEAAHPMKRQCTATNRQKKRCGRSPILGGTVCRMHGGAAPQVKAKALERLMQLQNAAIDRMAVLMHQERYPSTAFAAARDVLDRTMGKPTESVQVEQSGEVTYTWKDASA